MADDAYTLLPDMAALHEGLKGDPRAALVWDAIIRICHRSSVLARVRGRYGENIYPSNIRNFDFYVRAGLLRERYDGR